MNTKATNTSKKRSEQKRSRVTKSNILSASLAEFASVSFDGASTRGIAARAGVNHTLISHHFGSKEALWKATAEWVFGNYVQVSLERREGLRGVEEPALARVLLRDFIVFCSEVPNFHRFMMQANQSDPDRLNWLADRFLRPGAEFELDVLKLAQVHGLMPEGDILHIRYLFIGAATSIFTFASEFEYLTGDDPHQDAVVERHVDYVLALFNSKNTND